ncbi:hypothetical protein A3Q56_03324 [Intoshia linei]|uniref:Uncharacterized protein n=1 Tax=Intoshia linei TaxID=1819745 RepID=A0A177B6A2_9BILA|nr:hypothetical protein A3Q56_03324 [Intoshia linei]
MNVSKEIKNLILFGCEYVGSDESIWECDSKVSGDYPCNPNGWIQVMFYGKMNLNKQSDINLDKEKFLRFSDQNLFKKNRLAESKKNIYLNSFGVIVEIIKIKIQNNSKHYRYLGYKIGGNSRINYLVMRVHYKYTSANLNINCNYKGEDTWHPFMYLINHNEKDLHLQTKIKKRHFPFILLDKRFNASVIEKFYEIKGYNEMPIDPGDKISSDIKLNNDNSVALPIGLNSMEEFAIVYIMYYVISSRYPLGMICSKYNLSSIYKDYKKKTFNNDFGVINIEDDSGVINEHGKDKENELEDEYQYEYKNMQGNENWDKNYFKTNKNVKLNKFFNKNIKNKQNTLRIKKYELKKIIDNWMDKNNNVAEQSTRSINSVDEFNPNYAAWIYKQSFNNGDQYIPAANLFGDI